MAVLVPIGIETVFAFLDSLAIRIKAIRNKAIRNEVLSNWDRSLSVGGIRINERRIRN